MSHSADIRQALALSLDSETLSAETVLYRETYTSVYELQVGYSVARLLRIACPTLDEVTLHQYPIM